MPRKHSITVVPAPVSPIEILASKFREVLHLPDASALYAVMGAAAANMIEGPPCWIMLVGPPSCGKTELLNSLLGVNSIVEGGDISGEAAFLSGTSAKDTAVGATGGLLRQIGDSGGLILNDFTSVLSKPKDKIASIMAVFRETYGGRWTRHLGSDGGRIIQWRGRLALFGGVTGAIDMHHQVSAELGERWIYFRYAHKDTYQEADMVLRNDRGDWREGLRIAVQEMFDGLGMAFFAPQPRRVFAVPEKLRLYRMATVAASCRSGIGRDAYTKEIIAAKEAELATRLTSVLGQLLVGMDAIGVPERTRWQLLNKVAMDSMPKIRRMIVDAIMLAPQTVDELQAVTEVSINVVKRTVEDLTVHGVVRLDGNKVVLTDWMRSNYKPGPLKV